MSLFGALYGALSPRGAQPAAAEVVAPPPPNLPPTVTITSPANGATITAVPTTVTLSASDSDGTVANVQLFANGVSVGVDASAPYEIPWSPLNGTVTLVGRATDDDSATGDSPAIVVTIAVPVNEPPNVAITSPTNGATITSVPSNVSITASDPGGSVTKVELFVDGSKVGEDTTDPYTISMIPADGAHTLVARATDNEGLTADSAPISVTVNTAVPPGTTIAQLQIKNDGAGSTGTDWVTVPLGHTFKAGDIPSGYYPRFKIAGGGADVDYSYWNKSSHADGSWRFCGLMLRIPTALAGGATMTIDISAVNTAPAATSRTLSEATARDFKMKGTGRRTISAVEWTSSLNTGISDADSIIEYTASGRGGGNVCRYWRVGQGFRNGSTESLHCYGWFYIFVIQNAAGGLYGFRVTPVLANPFANGYGAEDPGTVVFEDDFGFFDNTTLVGTAPVQAPFTFYRDTSYVRGYEIAYSGITGGSAFPQGYITGGTSGTVAYVYYSPAANTIVTKERIAGTGFVNGETITLGAISATITTALTKTQFRSADVAGIDMYKFTWGKLSTTGTLPTGLSTSGTYGTTRTKSQVEAFIRVSMSEYGPLLAHGNGELNVTTTGNGSGTHTFTPLPCVPRAHRVYVTNTRNSTLFIAGGGTGADIDCRPIHSLAYIRKTGFIPPLPLSISGVVDVSTNHEYRIGNCNSTFYNPDESQSGPEQHLGLIIHEAARHYLISTKRTWDHLMVYGGLTAGRQIELLDRTTQQQPVARQEVYPGLGLNFYNKRYYTGAGDEFPVAGWKWNYGYANYAPAALSQGDRFTAADLSHAHPGPHDSAMISGRAEFLDQALLQSGHDVLKNAISYDANRNWTHPSNGQYFEGYTGFGDTQSRDTAWQIRSLMRSLYMCPDADPRRPYFEDLYDVLMEGSYTIHQYALPGWNAVGMPVYYDGVARGISGYGYSHTVFSHLYFISVWPWLHRAIPHARSAFMRDQVAKWLPYWKGKSLAHFYQACISYWFNQYYTYIGGVVSQPLANTPHGEIFQIAGMTWDGTANTITFPYLNGHASGNTGNRISPLANGDRIQFVASFGAVPTVPGGVSVGSAVYWLKNVVTNSANSYTFQLSTQSDLSTTVDITTTGGPNTTYACLHVAAAPVRSRWNDPVVLVNAVALKNMVIASGGTIPADVLSEMTSWEADYPTLQRDYLRFATTNTWD